MEQAHRVWTEEWTETVPGVNCNENPEEFPDRPEIETSKLAKVTVSHALLERMLDLPNDIKITSMHTTRGEENTCIYMICNRFDIVPEGAVAPTISIENAKSLGMWDTEENNEQ